MWTTPPNILVLIAEAETRGRIARILAHEGLAVSTARQASDALRTLEERPADLIILEAELPGGLSATETVRLARRRHPHLKAIFISGRVAGLAQRDPGSEELAAQSYDRRELLGCVFELLTRPLENGAAAIAQIGLEKAEEACRRQQHQWPGAEGRVILVVDDDDAVRELAVDLFRSQGHRILEAGGGTEALALLRRPGPIDLLFTDIVMPDLDGFELARQARQIRPELKIVYTSGYSTTAAQQKDERRYGPLVAKPWRGSQLQQQIDAALAA